MSEQKEQQQHDHHDSQQEDQEKSTELPIENGRRKALIIGISNYDDNRKFSNLDLCENNANEVYRILKAKGYDIPSHAMLWEEYNGQT